MSKSRKARPRSEPKAAGPASAYADPSAQGTLGNAALLANMPGPQDVGKEDAPTIAGVANQIPFEPRLSTANQLSKVVVRGYDPVKKKEIVGEGTAPGGLGTKTAAVSDDEPGTLKDVAVVAQAPDVGKDEAAKRDPSKKK